MNDRRSEHSEDPTSHQLVEHFFRHQYGRIVGILSRWFGVKHLQSVEDAVGVAMEKALRRWPVEGRPADPAAWLYRAARNHLIDQLRRERLHARFVDVQAAQQDATTQDQIDPEFGDETLRLLFLCCHPQIPLASQMAFALKTVCGFSVQEIARGLMIQTENAQKRIERARKQMADCQLELESLRHPWMKQRATAVQTVIYLMFNEGYLVTGGQQPVQQELCQESIRLGRLLAQQPVGAQGSTYALLALMCFHVARQQTRVSATGRLVLLEEQDRTKWDAGWIAEAMGWMGKMATDEPASRYHLEAAIAWEHVRSPSMEMTDWSRLVKIYKHLCRLVPGPAQYLNLAIAESQALGPVAGWERLQQFPKENRPARYPLWDSVEAELLAQMGRKEEARQKYRSAIRSTTNQAERLLLEEKLARLVGS